MFGDSSIIIHSKSTGSELVRQCFAQAGNDIDKLAESVNKIILTKKIKFPVLEHCAKDLYKEIALAKQLDFLDTLITPKEMGSWVIAGMMLQLRLEKQLDECLQKATYYIIEGNEWYVCDIVGERVIGHALLKYPALMLPKLPVLAAHPDKWIVRSVGVAAHYATKKGMQPYHAEEVFKLLLSLANTTDFHTKKGIGWGAKTIARFHPYIIEKYTLQIFENPYVKQWFRTKVKIGVGRSNLKTGGNLTPT